MLLRRRVCNSRLWTGVLIRGGGDNDDSNVTTEIRVASDRKRPHFQERRSGPFAPRSTDRACRTQRRDIIVGATDRAQQLIGMLAECR